MPAQPTPPPQKKKKQTYMYIYIYIYAIYTYIYIYMSTEIPKKGAKPVLRGYTHNKGSLSFRTQISPNRYLGSHSSGDDAVLPDSPALQISFPAPASEVLRRISGFGGLGVYW